MKISSVVATIVLANCGSSAFGESDVSPSLDRGTFSPFIRSLNVQPHGYAMINDPTGAAPVQKVERFEVRSGDCHFNGAWSDCERNRERSELWEQGKRSPLGTTAWYGWSFHVPSNWPDVWPTKTVLTQFHQHRSHPIWMFANRNGGLVLDDKVGGFSSLTIPLIDAADFAGKWNRIEVHAKWEKDSSGFLNIWVDGDLKVEHRGQTMTAETTYFRYGVYRSFVSRYKAKTGQKTVPTQIVLFANVKKASTRAGLE